MDLFAEMIRVHASLHAQLIEPIPPYSTFFAGRVKGGVNLDRLRNRYWLYPKAVSLIRADRYVIADHSYAHLVHSLPTERTAVVCHDLNAFRSILEPEREPRPWWFRKLMKRVLTGFQKARWVIANSADTQSELLKHRVVPAERIRMIPPAAAPEFTADVSEGRFSLPWIDVMSGSPWLLHVGSCVPRKRIGDLLNIFQQIHQHRPDLKLVKISGDFTNEHRELIHKYRLKDSIIHRTGLSRMELAEVYRRASVVLMPSDHEGFGLPVLEASACGAPVVASDLKIFREVGLDGISYAPVGDIRAWVQVVKSVLDGSGPSREARLKLARGYTWEDYTRNLFSLILNS
jgi:glycosyltransferase involved in cell wall biosynthesis